MSERIPLGFLKSRPAQLLTLFLLLQASVFYGTSRTELQPENRPLKDFPTSLAHWQLVQEGVVDEETRAVLQADDLLSRTYVRAETSGLASLFVAFFRSQRTGKAPHSPKNCLPGNGWVQQLFDETPIDVPGLAKPIHVNRWVIAKGDSQSVALYWYQSRDRAVASEYRAKFFVVADALRYNRSDTSLVRVVVPVSNKDHEAATEYGKDFIRAIYPALLQFLPQ